MVYTIAAFYFPPPENTMRQASRTLSTLGFPQDSIIIYKTGKILFGKKIVEMFVRTKKYFNLAISPEDNNVYFNFYSYPKHDRQPLYNAPAGRMFCFVGRNTINELKHNRRFSLDLCSQRTISPRSLSVSAPLNTAKIKTTKE